MLDSAVKFEPQTSKFGPKRHFSNAGTRSYRLLGIYLPQSQSLPQTAFAENDLCLRTRARAPYAAAAAMIANTNMVWRDIVVSRIDPP